MPEYEYMTITAKEACSLLPKREEDSHKGNFGTLLAVAGSVFYTGAAALCCSAAAKSGVGITCLCSVKEACAVVGAVCPEVTFLPFEADVGGTLPENAAEKILERSKSATALLIGCGLGNNGQTSGLVRRVLTEKKLSTVVDADGLNTICASPELLRGSVITPHIGEMARLLSCESDTVKADPANAALYFAKEYDCVVALKDSDTVVASPDGTAFIHRGRNSALAKGGSGDVLAGLTASLLAQGMGRFDAVITAVTLHGEAGRRAAEKYSKRGALPHELADELRLLFAENGL